MDHAVEADMPQTPDIDTAAKEWIEKQSAAEVNRVRSFGTSILPLKVLNFGIVTNVEKKRPRAVNRIELDSMLNVNDINEIIVSPEQEYPHKPGFCYVNLILRTSRPVPYLVPYLYQTNVQTTRPDTGASIVLKNDLKQFMFINKKGVVARLSIDTFHAVQ